MKKFRLRDYLPVLIMVLCAAIFGVLLATGVMDLDTVPQLVADRPVLAVLVVLAVGGWVVSRQVPDAEGLFRRGGIQCAGGRGVHGAAAAGGAGRQRRGDGGVLIHLLRHGAVHQDGESGVGA